MRGERGQASIEWVGAVLIVAVALTGLARLASRVEAADLATSPLRNTICAVRGDCEPTGEGRAEAGGGRPTRGGPGPGTLPREAVTVPPLLPLVPDPRPERARPAPRRHSPGGGLARRARPPAGKLWRRAWLICFGYERARYGLLHPESPARHTVSISGTLQMVNDCASPIDFSRDWELLRPR